MGSIMSVKSINLAFLLIALGAFMAGSTVAAEVSLDSAKSQGLIGEQYDGYLGVVDAAATAQVKHLVDDVNTRRRAEYERIAQSNNISVSDVEALAGQKALRKTAAGDYIKVPGEGWRKK